MTTKQIASLKRLCAKASEGPWRLSRRAHAVKNAFGEYVVDYSAQPVTAEGRADLAFIASARKAIPDLIAEIERLRSNP